VGMCRIRAIKKVLSIIQHILCARVRACAGAAESLHTYIQHQIMQYSNYIVHKIQTYFGVGGTHKYEQRTHIR